jgi:N-alpha-acetyltransferase 15/16, NatA auxiliary subunit
MLRDAANLHIQLRNFDALEEVRLAMLRLRPNLRQSWIGMALAYHLNGNLADARATLETYDTLLKVRQMVRDSPRRLHM